MLSEILVFCCDHKSKYMVHFSNHKYELTVQEQETKWLLFMVNLLKGNPSSSKYEHDNRMQFWTGTTLRICLETI